MKLKIENLVNYSIISFGLLPIMPNNLTGVLIVIISLTSFIYFLKTPTKKILLKPFLINSVLFFALIISLFYSSDLSNAFRKLGPAILIIIFPLIFYILLAKYNIKKKVIYITLNLFSISTILFLLLYYIFLFFAPHPDNPALDYFSIFSFRKSLIDMPIWGKHPIYLSIFIAISIINVLRIGKISFKKNKLFFYTVLIFQSIFIITLLLMSSKAVILSLLVTSIIILYIHSKNKSQTFFISILIFTLLYISILFIPQVNARFKELFLLKTYSLENLDYRNSSQIHVAIWQTAIEKIKEAPVFGYGIGDVKSVLHEGYKDKSPILLKKNYNAHNQYLSIWLGVGIIGFLLLFYFLIFNYKIAIKNKDYMFIAILIFFSLNFLTENIIERQTGAMLFFFLINLFGFYNYKRIE